MSEVAFLKELLIVLTVTLSIVFLFQRLGIPAIVGFLLAGVVIGPHGLKLVSDLPAVAMIANIGLIILLFTIGLEMSLAELAVVRGYAVWTGLLQILLTILIVAALSVAVKMPLAVALFYGFLVANSSTAVILRILSDRGESDSLHGRVATGMLIVQDLSLVPMALLIPVLVSPAAISAGVVLWTLAQALFAVGLIVLAARYVVPRLVHQVALLKNRELFTLFILFVSFGTAYLASQFGISLALGAFIAGLLISESEYSHQMVSDLLPLRDCFSGVFFMSIGMLLDLGYVIADLPAHLAALASLIVIKTAVILLIFWLLYGSLRLGLVIGMSFAQMGEFSFVLAESGRTHGLLTDNGEQMFLTTSILSLMATPLFIQWSHRLGFGIEESMAKPAPARSADGDRESEKGHVVVVGYGLNGQNLTRVLKEVGIRYRVLDMDPAVARAAKQAGEPIVFGDGTRPEILDRLAIDGARVLVVAVSDPVATARIVAEARRLKPDLSIVVRTRYVAEIERLYRMGANQVIPEEFETSVEIFSRVLHEYHLPRNLISLQVDLIRREHYGALRGLRIQGKRLDELAEYLAGTTADTVLVPEGSSAAGKTLADIGLGERSGVTVIAVVRAGLSTPNPRTDFRLASGDILVLLGNHQQLDEATRVLAPSDH
ncbi:MAG TPA: cation:proton antiporter [Verrucomicrobiae bacterium]|jgi:monovalent cation:H+ antiporter-2, CPA2 family|nr:cation:proton antiporter [Verrucomicrobiae bacterium]